MSCIKCIEKDKQIERLEAALKANPGAMLKQMQEIKAQLNATKAKLERYEK